MDPLLAPLATHAGVSFELEPTARADETGKHSRPTAVGVTTAHPASISRVTRWAAPNPAAPQINHRENELAKEYSPLALSRS